MTQGPLGTQCLCHCSAAPAFQRPPQQEKGSKHRPAETSCFLISAPGGRAAVGPGLSLHFILQGQETKDGLGSLLINDDGELLARQSAAAVQSCARRSPSPPALGWQQHFLRGPQILDVGPLQNPPSDRGMNWGSGAPRSAPGRSAPHTLHGRQSRSPKPLGQWRCRTP